MSLHRKIRNLGIVLVCYTLLSRCVQQLGSETNLFQKKSKQILGNLLSTINGVIVGHSSLKNLYETSQQTGFNVDAEEIKDELTTHAEIIEIVHDIMVDMSTTQVYDLLTYLKEFHKTGKLFTSTDLEEIKKTYDIRFTKLEEGTSERLKIIEEKASRGEIIWKEQESEVVS